MRPILLSVLIVAAGCAAERATTTTTTTTGGTSSGSSDQPAWMELTQPTTQHQQLAQLAGRYDVQCKAWMPMDASSQQPRQPQNQQPQAQESTAQATFTPILGDRFIREDFTGQMNGAPFTGMGIEGFDRIRQQWTMTWIDSMSTGTLMAKGMTADDGKTVIYLGETSCPMTGAVVPTRMIRRIGEDGRIDLEMYQTRNGKEDKAMELHYTKAKGDGSQR